VAAGSVGGEVPWRIMPLIFGGANIWRPITRHCDHGEPTDELLETPAGCAKSGRGAASYGTGRQELPKVGKTDDLFPDVKLEDFGFIRGARKEFTFFQSGKLRGAWKSAGALLPSIPGPGGARINYWRIFQGGGRVRQGWGRGDDTLTDNCRGG